MDSSQGQALPHDSSGFLIGERLVKGVDLVGKDTAEILKILRASFGLQVISNNRLRVTLDRINNKLSSQTIDVTPTPSPVPRLGNSGNANPLPTVDVGAPSDNRPIPPTRELGDPPPDSISDPAPVPPDTANPPPSNEPSGDGGNAAPPDVMPPDDGRRNNGRRRNSRGQFEGDGLTDEERKRKAEEAAKAKAEKEANDNLKKSIMEGISLGNADTQNIDPTVDAVRELGDLMSPLAKVGKTMFKGAAWLFRRKKKREEPSDQEQRQQSRIEKLLKRIAGSRVGQAAGSGFNLFGGLFSSLTGTAGSLLSGLGGLLRGALLPALGLTGAFKFGEWLGGKIYNFIEPALSSTIDAVMAIPEKIGKAWDSVVGAASQAIEDIVNRTKEIKKNVVDAYDKTRENVSYKIEAGANKANRFYNWGKGVYQGAVSKVADGMQSVDDFVRPIVTRKAQPSFTQDKAQSVKATAERLGVSPNDLAQIISFESAGSFDPAKKNMGGGSATGLIQFTQSTAKQMGTTTEDLAKMSFEQQMAYVEKYFVDRGIGKNGKTSIADMYNVVQGVPKSGYKAGTKAYDQNKAWDVNKDGVIMPNEAVTGKGFMAHAKDYYPVASAATTKVVAPAAPMSVPKLLARPMPEVPKQKQQVSTKEQKPMQVSVVGGNEAISQNLSDRHLAHAVTGGLGMDSLRHG